MSAHEVAIELLLPGTWHTQASDGEETVVEARATVHIRLEDDGPGLLAFVGISAVIHDNTVDEDGITCDERYLRWQLGQRGFEALVDRAGLCLARDFCLEAGAEIRGCPNHRFDGHCQSQ